MKARASPSPKTGALRSAGVELQPAAEAGQQAFVQWLRRWPVVQQQKLKDAVLLLLLEGTR